MESIKEMVDVNTIVGDAVETPDGSVVIPISRVSFGFASGGGDYGGSVDDNQKDPHPFAGGSGAGVSIQPVAFLVVGRGRVRLLPIDSRAMYDRLIDLAPQVLKQLGLMVDGAKNSQAGDEFGPPPPEYQPWE